MQKDLDYYKSEINLAEYLLNLGYAIDKSRDTRNYRCLEYVGDKDFPNKVVVTRNAASRHFLYFCIFDKANKGSIIDFHSYNKIDSSIYIMKLKWDKYLREPSTFKNTVSIEPTTRVVMDNIFKEYDIQPLSNTQYLELRGIRKATLLLAQFSNTIKNQVVNYNGKNYTNTIFPILNEKGIIDFVNNDENIIGLNRKGEFLAKHKSLLKHSLREEGLWRSSIDVSIPIDKIVLCEHPIDAISHYELYNTEGTENNLYFASCGNLTNKQIDLLEKFINLEGKTPKTFVLANDNDTAGRLYNLELLGKLISPNSDKSGAFFLVSYDNKSNNFIATTPRKDGFISIDKEFNQLIDYLKFSKIFDENLIVKTESYDKNSDVYITDIRFTNTSEYYLAFADFIKQIKHAHLEFHLHTPIGKDFNDELTQKLLAEKQTVSPTNKIKL